MTPKSPILLEIGLKPHVRDSRGEAVAEGARRHLGLAVDRVHTRELFTIDARLEPEEAERIRAEFTDPVVQTSALGRLDPGVDFDWMLRVGFKPGVTDNVGRTARTAIGDLLGRPLAEGEAVHTSTVYLLSGGGLTREQATEVGLKLLANPVIETLEVTCREDWENAPPVVTAPRIDAHTEARADRIDLSGSDEDLMTISRSGTLALSLEEMRAIRDYFAEAAGTEVRQALGLDARPTDVELEMLAQTWSEHCKHKIFAASIDYTDATTGRSEAIDGLFKTYVKGTTDAVAKQVDWLVSVFHDNAGVIRFNERLNLVFKAETHNSPSALEPYGGAMTGIVGCNRDPLGTGLGAELLINIWGYCFASPDTPAEAVPEGVMHPRRLRDGVNRGVIDGGNQSGIPYGVGWEFFDERYMAKPMVYCGTVGLLPPELPDGRKAHEKEARPGDRIVMVGGRIGKDGIHGATFSSEELHQDSPVQAVQIGDPITQKKMSDFLIEARDAGLFSAITDNGAGGLSSSIGEMAEGPGGAEIDLACAPLKYAGLQPWEVWLSEAQERMSLAVPPEKMEALAALAHRRDVELTDLGEFNASGYLHLRWGEQTVGHISMAFLHDGCPRLHLRAAWQPPAMPTAPRPGDDLAADLTALLGRLNIASNEGKARQYDHEVKGRTIIKPFVGAHRDVPGDATVFLAEYGRNEGIVLSRGFNSHYADLDAGAMIAAALDEAVRRILAVGGRLDYIAGLDNFCWPDPVESPATPDGPYKLAQLVRACQALRATCEAYGVPLISGKDSMKNDSTRSGRKISIPPSVLISAIGRIDDVRRALTLSAKVPGEVVYVLGATRPELGASEWAYMKAGGSTVDIGALPIGGAVPQVDPGRTLPLYRAVERVAREGLVHSLHAPTLGGLAAGFARVAIGGWLGMAIDLDAVPTEGELNAGEILFSESCGRFIATVAPEKAEAFEAAFAGLDCARVGEVTEAHNLTLTHGGAAVADLPLAALRTAWQGASINQP